MNTEHCLRAITLIQSDHIRNLAQPNGPYKIFTNFSYYASEWDVLDDAGRAPRVGEIALTCIIKCGYPTHIDENTLMRLHTMDTIHKYLELPRNIRSMKITDGRVVVKYSVKKASQLHNVDGSRTMLAEDSVLEFMFRYRHNTKLCKK